MQYFTNFTYIQSTIIQHHIMDFVDDFFTGCCYWCPPQSYLPHSQPYLNNATHFFTVEYDGADIPNVASISALIFVGLILCFMNYSIIAYG